MCSSKIFRFDLMFLVNSSYFFLRVNARMAMTATIIVAPMVIRSIGGSSWGLGFGVGVCVGEGVVAVAGVGDEAGVWVVCGVGVGVSTSDITMFTAL